MNQDISHPIQILLDRDSNLGGDGVTLAYREVWINLEMHVDVILEASPARPALLDGQSSRNSEGYAADLSHNVVPGHGVGEEIDRVTDYPNGEEYHNEPNQHAAHMISAQEPYGIKQRQANRDKRHRSGNEIGNVVPSVSAQGGAADSPANPELPPTEGDLDEYREKDGVKSEA